MRVVNAEMDADGRDTLPNIARMALIPPNRRQPRFCIQGDPQP
jgi:hypothetical protein